MIKFMQRFLRAENGTTAIEYGLIAALVVVLVIGSVAALGQTIVNVFWVKIAAAI
jgi:pilus assembly protein Flp/PilA